MKISKEVKVGLFAISSIAIFYLGFNYLKGIDFFSATDKYYVVYEDVAGLQVSNPVKINGFSVGRVSDIRILQNIGNKILVEIELGESIVLGDSTTALLDADLFGTVSIVLEVGRIEEPIQPGDTLIARLDKALEDLLKESALPVADNLQATIRRINTILDGLSGNTEKINQTLGHLQEVTKNLQSITAQDNQERIKELLGNLNKVVINLDKSTQNIPPMISKYSALADTLRALELAATLENTNKTLESLDSAVTKVSEGDGTIAKLMNNDSLYNNLNKTLLDLDKLINHLNEYPKHFFAPLGKKKKKIDEDLKKSEN